MKRVIAGCIDLVLEFDSVDECNHYEELPGGRIRVRIQRQYNNSPFPAVMEGGLK